MTAVMGNRGYTVAAYPPVRLQAEHPVKQVEILPAESVPRLQSGWRS